MLAIPSRNLFVTANEEDLVEDGAARATVMIYERSEAPPVYPMVAVGDDDLFGWGALSGLTADVEQPGRLFAVSDSAYAEASIFAIDASQSPATIVQRIVVTADGAPVENLDLEGISARSEGGFWLASEGNASRTNRLIRVTDDGVVQEFVELPESLTAGMTNNGLEGVASVGAGDDEQVWPAVQREWADDAPGQVKLVSYTPSTQEWGYVRYPLDTPDTGRIGLSEITALGDGQFAIIERDNQIGQAARFKRLFVVSFDGVTPAPLGSEAPLVDKILVHDFMPDLLSTHGYAHDKIEGFTVDAAGVAYMATDNDGVDDASGETLFMAIDFQAP